MRFSAGSTYVFAFFPEHFFFYSRGFCGERGTGGGVGGGGGGQSGPGCSHVQGSEKCVAKRNGGSQDHVSLGCDVVNDLLLVLKAFYKTEATSSFVTRELNKPVRFLSCGATAAAVSRLVCVFFS